MPGLEEAKISSHYLVQCKQTIADSARLVSLRVNGAYLFIVQYFLKF